MSGRTPVARSMMSRASLMTSRLRRPSKLHCQQDELLSDVGSDPIVADVLNVKEQGSRPIVDPDRPLFQAADVSDRMRKLAESVLKKRRRAAA